MSEPKFKIGQLVQHLRNGYRGVIYDLDLTFQQSEAWYEKVALSQPPKDRPWYRVLVNGSSHETYVAERHLARDTTRKQIEHPELTAHFDEFRGDHYARTRDLN